MRLTLAISFLGLSLLMPSQPTFGFVVIPRQQQYHQTKAATTTTQRFNSEDPFERFDFPSDAEVIAEEVEMEPIDIAPEAIRLKEDLLALASATKRGFASTKEQRQKAKDIIFDLASYNPTKNPASPYYKSSDSGGMVYDTLRDGSTGSGMMGEPTLAGKWTLIYTDAPDITTLDGGPLATAKLGRIGQECNPPFIKNVIEWRRPDWAANLPFSGSEDSRVLQKVCTEASAKPEKPFVVDLKIVGLDLMGMGSSSNGDAGMGNTPSSSSDAMDNLKNLPDSLQKDGIPAGLLKSNPIELRGPLTAPFGQFEILYLDDEMRIIKTGQNYLAVNVRDEEEWF